MNYIAHLLLAYPHEPLMVGNFIADGLKATEYHNYSPGILTGIAMHHFIDSFTDAHTNFKHSKSLLFDNYKHYAAVLVDIFYDYFLARHWSAFCAISLAEFSEKAIAVLQKSNATLPPKSKEFLQYIITSNTMPHYGELATIQKVLQGMSHRAHFDSGMEKATIDLVHHSSEIENDFSVFFPQLLAQVQEFIRQHYLSQ